MAKLTLVTKSKTRPVVGVKEFDSLIEDVRNINDNTTNPYKDGANTWTAINTFSNEIRTSSNIGAAFAGTTAVEYGAGGGRHKTVLTIAAFTQAIAGAALGFGKQIYTFPQGIVKAVYATADLTISAPTETGTPDIGVGTAVATGVIDVLSGDATFEDIMDGFTGTAITTVGSLSNNYVQAEAGLLDGHTTATKAFLNLAETWTATEEVTISGTVTIFWDFLGDY